MGQLHDIWCRHPLKGCKSQQFVVFKLKTVEQLTFIIDELQLPYFIWYIAFYYCSWPSSLPQNLERGCMSKLYQTPWDKQYIDHWDTFRNNVKSIFISTTMQVYRWMCIKMSSTLLLPNRLKASFIFGAWNLKLQSNQNLMLTLHHFVTDSMCWVSEDFPWLGVFYLHLEDKGRKVTRVGRQGRYISQV